MSGVVKAIEELSPERYARLAKRTARLVKESCDRLDQPFPAELQYLLDTPQEQIEQDRRDTMQERASHARNAIEDFYSAARHTLPDRITREDFEEVVMSIYRVGGTVVRRDVLGNSDT